MTAINLIAASAFGFCDLKIAHMRTQGGRSMSWTDERVETLRKLWLDGKSASQIAAELSNGITRNAVIGKVHRLGLSGRVKAPAPAAPRPRPAKPQATQQRPVVTTRTMTTSASPMTRGATALAYAPREEMLPIERPAAEDVVIPMSERVTITDLREAMCRWPLGDPATSDFRYCGAKSPIGTPYCTFHSRVAYQPVQERRRERDRERRAQQALSRL
jgi:GcrA cell cycle regulator